MEEEKQTPANQYADIYKFFIFGQSGSGKTTIGCTAPNPVIALTEVGRSSRRITGMERALNKKINIVEIKTKADIMRFCRVMAKKTDKVYTCILDSVSDLQYIITQELIGTKGEKYTEDPDSYQLTQPDYGYIGRSVESVIREFASLPHNVIVLCHQKEYVVKKGIEEARRIVPALQGDTIPTSIGKLFHAVGYAFSRDGQYYVSFQSDDMNTKMDDGLRKVEVPNASIWIERMRECAEKGSFAYSCEDFDTTKVKNISGNEAATVVEKRKK